VCRCQARAREALSARCPSKRTQCPRKGCRVGITSLSATPHRPVPDVRVSCTFINSLRSSLTHVSRHARENNLHSNSLSHSRYLFVSLPPSASADALARNTYRDLQNTRTSNAPWAQPKALGLGLLKARRGMRALAQGYLAHKEAHPFRTFQHSYPWPYDDPRGGGGGWLLDPRRKGGGGWLFSRHPSGALWLSHNSAISLFRLFSLSLCRSLSFSVTLPLSQGSEARSHLRICAPWSALA